MSTDRVERVARALCAAYGDEWEDKPESGVGLNAGHHGLPARDDFREMARAALAADEEWRLELQPACAREDCNAAGACVDAWEMSADLERERRKVAELLEAMRPMVEWINGGSGAFIRLEAHEAFTAAYDKARGQ